MDRIKPGQLGLLLLTAALLGLPDITAPLVMPDDWAHSQFLVYARNYFQLGPFLEWTIPCFGEVNGRGIVYANHPWLASVLLGLWGLPFDYSEAAYRSLGLLFSLISIYAVARVGERLGGARAGLLCALLFGFTPLGIHVSRVYLMEPVHIAFLLLAYLQFLRWRQEGKGYRLCLVLLALAQASDIYALFFCPWAFLLWLRQRGRPDRQSDLAWWGIILVPIGVQLALMAIVAQRSLGGHTLQRGVARAGRPWEDWVDPNYWLETGAKLMWNYGYALPVLAAVALVVWRLHSREQRPDWIDHLGFWWFYASLYTLVGTEWMKNHHYLVIFWGPALALQGGLLLAELKPRVGWVLAVGYAALSVYLFGRFYSGPIPLHFEELRFAERLRQEVRSGDIVIGIPAHVAYYVNHKASIPYDFFMRAGLSEPAELNSLVREVVGQGIYRRVIICPRLIQYPRSLKSQDLRNLYPAGAPYQAVASSIPELLIWELR